MRIKNKLVPFSQNEIDLLNWSENRGKPFAAYIKDLIRADMKKEDAYSENNLKKIIQNVIDNMDIDVKSKDKPQKSILSDKSKAAYKNLLKRK